MNPAVKPASVVSRLLVAAALAFATLASPAAHAESSLPTQTPSLDWHGSGFVMLQPNPSDAASFLFVETGAYEMLQPAGTQAAGGPDITLTYSVYGTVDAYSGVASFLGGVVNLYADSQWNFGAAAPGSATVYGANDGALIGSFKVVAGGGAANSSAVTVQAESIAGSIANGYFFSSGGTDMADERHLNLAVSIGNAIDYAPSSAVVSEIVCKAASFPGPGCIGSAFGDVTNAYSNSPYYFVVTDHAQAVLTAVPEPTSAALALAGLGMVGWVASRRSKR